MARESTEFGLQRFHTKVEMQLITTRAQGMFFIISSLNWSFEILSAND